MANRTRVGEATGQRLDFGLALRGALGDLPGRLVETGGLKKGDRITHRFGLASVADIDDEVRHWLMVAYDLDA